MSQKEKEEEDMAINLILAMRCPCSASEKEKATLQEIFDYIGIDVHIEIKKYRGSQRKEITIHGEQEQVEKAEKVRQALYIIRDAYVEKNSKLAHKMFVDFIRAYLKNKKM